MKATCYLRIAKTSRGHIFSATTKHPDEPLYSNSRALPTVLLKVVLDLPANAFDSVLATLVADVPESQLGKLVSMEIEEPDEAT